MGPVWLMRLRERFGWTPELDSHQLIMAARMTALLEDFGPGNFRREMDQVIDSLNDSGLTVDRYLQCHSALRDLLVERLNLVQTTKLAAAAGHNRADDHDAQFDRLRSHLVNFGAAGAS
jgi:hypothetical protein